MNPLKIINKNLNDHLAILKKDKKILQEKVIFLSNKIIRCFENNGKILIFGNGGSAADAQHFATELTVRLKKNRRALPAISLATDTSCLTAIGNDLGFKNIFKRQIEALANYNDLIIPISTSGNSNNILEAVKFCKKKKLFTFGILGNKGGKTNSYFENHYIVGSNNPSRIQEVHVIFWQTVCEVVENYYAFKKS